MFNEEKRKVGRPKLADTDLKRKSLLLVIVCFIAVVATLFVGAYKLNIIRFNKMKGEIVCSEIPLKYQPKTEANPQGLYEYGFEDEKFYSAVIGLLPDANSSLCSTVEEDDFKDILYIPEDVGDDKGFTSVNGLQYLTELKILYINENGLSSVDLSGNRKLEILHASSNEFTNINLENNDRIEDLWLNFNKLTHIELSNLSRLRAISVMGNQLTSLEVGANENITHIYAQGNRIESINVDENLLLRHLALSNNSLTGINVDKNEALVNLYLDGNSITDIDLRSNTMLKDIRIHYNQLSDINLENNSSLTYLNISHNNLTELHLDGKTALKNLYVNNNSLTDLNLDTNTSLVELDVSSNKSLHFLDLSHNSNITSLTLTNRYFNTNYEIITGNKVDVEYSITSANPEDTTYQFEFDDVAGYKDGKLLGKEPGYTSFSITYRLSDNYTYTISSNVNVTGLYSSKYAIDYEAKEIDANNDYIEDIMNYIYATDGYTVEMEESDGEVLIHLKNADEEDVTEPFTVVGINKEVEDAYIKAGFSDENFYKCIAGDKYNFVVPQSVYESTTEIYCPKMGINDISGIEKFTNLKYLTLSANNIKVADLSNNKNLAWVSFGYNKLTDINVAGLDKLVTLSVGNNELTSLNINDTKVAVLLAQNNKISKITGLDQSTNIGYFVAYNNKLTSVDLKNSEVLEKIALQDNPLTKPIYIIKGSSIEYNPKVALNSKYEIEREIVDTSIASYRNGSINAIKEGVTEILNYTEEIDSVVPYFYDVANYVDLFGWEESQEYINKVGQEHPEVVDNYENAEYQQLGHYLSHQIKVYDIKSSVYKIDKDKKVIDTNGNEFTVKNVKITLDGLTAKVKDGKLIIYDGNEKIEEFNIINTNKINKGTVKGKGGTKKKKTNNPKDDKKSTGDIYLTVPYVSSSTLLKVKDTNNNIYVDYDGIKITINGKSIKKVTGDLDLTFYVVPVSESNIKKGLISDGLVLRFVHPSKIYCDINIEFGLDDNLLKHINVNNVRHYIYTGNKLKLTTNKVSIKEGKLSTTISNMNEQVFSSNEPVLIATKRITKQEEKTSYWCWLWLLVIPVIGYTIYKIKKSKTSN